MIGMPNTYGVPVRTREIQNYFIDELLHENFTVDKTGAKTIELIGASFLADASSIFGKPNYEYITAELNWYAMQSTNIHDIYGGDKEPPQAWQFAADEHGNINSNYGTLIYSNQFNNQYDQVFNELVNHPDSRRASMIYQRPSIWNEYNKGSMSDFICTNAVTYYIRDKRLHCVVQMRSNDVVFGYKNDFAWQYHVLKQLAARLTRDSMVEIEDVGDICWQVQNLHVYERHFDLVK